MTQESSGLYFNPDVSNCDREPIHIIGHIQSIGYLMVLHRETNCIEQVSKNIEEITDVPAERLIGQRVDEFFSFSFVEDLKRLPDSSGHRSLKIDHRDQTYILSTHLSEGYLVIEMEKDNREDHQISYFQYSGLMDNIVLDMDFHDSIEDVCQSVVEKVRKITGFNRMMTYKFDEEGNGEVVAETMDEGIQSYKGLKFPASDIPEPARALYMKNTIRGIWDVEDEAVPVFPLFRKSDNKPLDLTHSFLRSVSPMHIYYLKNMGVRSSFSISIIVRDQLWGLILGHHTEEPVKLNVYQRRACQFIGKVLSHKMEDKSENIEFVDHREKLQILHRVISNYLSSADLHRSVRENSEDLLKAFKGSGYALFFEDELSQSSDLDRLWLNQLIVEIQLQDETIFYTGNFSHALPNLTQIPSAPAGVMAIKLSQNLNEFLLIFRKEEQKEVHWAGRPHKHSDPSVPLSPRNSFEKWTEMVKGQSRPWDLKEIKFAREFRMQLIENIIIATNEIKPTHSSGKNKLRMRLIERVHELEESNKKMEVELKVLRKKEAQHRLAKEIAEERNQLKAIEPVM